MPGILRDIDNLQKKNSDFFPFFFPERWLTTSHGEKKNTQEDKWIIEN